MQMLSLLKMRQRQDVMLRTPALASCSTRAAWQQKPRRRNRVWQMLQQHQHSDLRQRRTTRWSSWRLLRRRAGGLWRMRSRHGHLIALSSVALQPDACRVWLTHNVSALVLGPTQ